MTGLLDWFGSLQELNSTKVFKVIKSFKSTYNRSINALKGKDKLSSQHDRQIHREKSLVTLEESTRTFHFRYFQSKFPIHQQQDISEIYSRLTRLMEDWLIKYYLALLSTRWKWNWFTIKTLYCIMFWYFRRLDLYCMFTVSIWIYVIILKTKRV